MSRTAADPRRSRRGFLHAAMVATAGLGARRVFAFDGKAAPGPPALRLGYAAITWNGQDEQAMDEIAALGFRGIQLRASVLPAWGQRPAELRRRLDDKGLALLCFSSGSVDAVPEKEREYRETHTANARFVKALGGDKLQIISRRPVGRAPTPAEFERLGRLLTEIGRRTRAEGVHLVYHNHMDAFGEAPDEVARVLEVTDARFVSLLLDIAHYVQGGGDPAAAVVRHQDRLAILHLKDVAPGPLPGDKGTPPKSYHFVELGRGRVDVPGVMAAVKRVGFRGQAVIELDAVPEPGGTPASCAAANKKYAVETLGLSL